MLVSGIEKLTKRNNDVVNFSIPDTNIVIFEKVH